MITSSTPHTTSFYFPFIPCFLRDQLILLLLTSCLSSFQLYSLVQTTLLLLTLASVILFLFLELSSDKVHMEEFLLPLEWVRTEVFVMCHGLAQARSDTIQDDIDEVMVSHLSIDSESINIIQLFLDSTCLFEITYLVKSPVWLIVVTIVHLNGVLDLFTSIELMLVRLPPFQRISLGV